MAAFTAIMIGLMIAGMVTQAVAEKKAGDAAAASGTAAKRASDSQADLADYNAAVATMQSQDAIARGVEQENKYRTQVRGIIGQQRAGIAANNIDVAFGSAVDVQGDAAFLGELDALTIRTNAAREAWGYDVQAEDLHARATIARQTGVYQEAAGRQAATASNYAVAGTLIGGTTSLMMQRYGFNQATRPATQSGYVTVPYPGYGVLR
jgi:hypothetical protein